MKAMVHTGLGLILLVLNNCGVLFTHSLCLSMCIPSVILSRSHLHNNNSPDCCLITSLYGLFSSRANVKIEQPDIYCSIKTIIFLNSTIYNSAKCVFFLSNINIYFLDYEKVLDWAHLN